MTEKLSSQQWSERFNVMVTDPDGWDRKNFDASWAEEITEDEFRRRLHRSSSLSLSKRKPVLA